MPARYELRGFLSLKYIVIHIIHQVHEMLFCFLIPGDLLEYLSKDQQCTYSCIVAYSVEVVGFRTTITFWFNNEAFHSPSLSLALLDDTIFKSLSGSSASITVSNKPQPRGTSNTPRDRYVHIYTYMFY